MVSTIRFFAASKLKDGGHLMRKAKKAAKKTVAKKKVRCVGKTKAGKKCKRFTDGRSKFCALHKKRR
jgi:hypothetical protein